MRTRIAIAVAATALAALAAPSWADAPPYSGGCRLDAANDRTPNHAFGGPQSYNGVASIAVVTDEPLAPVSVSCEVYVDGTSQGVVLSGSGRGAVTNATKVQFTAGPDDQLTLCTVVEIGAQAQDWRCVDVDPLLEDRDGVTVRSAVVGYITIIQTAPSAPPQYQLHGALADSTLWRCSDNYPATPYAVSCEPNPGVLLTWRCDVLHADVTTSSAASRARISLDCDGWGQPEAQTRVATGVDHDSRWSTSSSTVTQFICTVDDGDWGAATAAYSGGCGDPGLPTVE